MQIPSLLEGAHRGYTIIQTNLFHKGIPKQPYQYITYTDKQEWHW